jgi:hypothetical protein
MTSDEAGRAAAGTATPWDELLSTLKALEQAYIRWDLAAIARLGGAARLAVERARSLGGHGGAGELRELMALVRRCQALADSGGRLASTLARGTALTYRPPAAETRGKEPDRRNGGQEDRQHGTV